jgi:hypothetical protein
VSFCPSRDQRAVSDLIAEMFTSDHPERCRMGLQLNGIAVSVQLCGLVDEGECVGILVIMELVRKGAGQKSGGRR